MDPFQNIYIEFAKSTRGVANIADGSAMDQDGSTSVYIAFVFQNGQNPQQGSQILPTDPRWIKVDPPVEKKGDRLKY